ncbi:DUF6934 family protein [Algoriphagus boritolerans]|uniref:Uncharacterized protein n=2 Tax=Algoriphagus TaxID=246875 RepID=A0A1H5XH57_9BACT|nr:hypothetical protein [Algoriphagus boritolerans]SEG11049.1 hypothetical protein SAMN03080598_02529 [Algoriphagus boritolerans DSM 17298 = JCM 18970]
MTGSTSYEISILNSDSEHYLYGFATPSGNFKIVEHSLIETRDERKVYNLGFGDFNAETGQVIDDEVFNRGDGRIILNTVLSTIPLFFDQNPSDALIVQGSDSRDDFPDKCRLTCRKSCTERCKKQHQRIRIYCKFLDKNFNSLVKTYIFFGLSESKTLDFEQYIPGKEYKSVLIYKKK